MTRPMPLEAPVIRTDLPLRSMSIAGSLIDLEDFAGERRADDFGRSACDQIAARAAPHGLDGEFGRESRCAVELHATVGRLEAKFRAEDFGHIGVMAAGDALVDLPG